MQIYEAFHFRKAFFIYPAWQTNQALTNNDYFYHKSDQR